MLVYQRVGYVIPMAVFRLASKSGEGSAGGLSLKPPLQRHGLTTYNVRPPATISKLGAT